jgi:hypothetical protein
MSILHYNFKELTQCISEAERIEAKVNRKNKWSTKENEEERSNYLNNHPQ